MCECTLVTETEERIGETKMFALCDMNTNLQDVIYHPQTRGARVKDGDYVPLLTNHESTHRHPCTCASHDVDV